MLHRYRRWLVVFLATILLGTMPAWAHDGWIEIHPAVAEQGQAVSVFLFFGNHSNEHKSYRLAGKWDPRYTQLSLVDPSGRVRDVTAQMIDVGEDDATGPTGPKGFHLAAPVPSEPGLYLAVARQVRVLQFNGPKFQSIMMAKTVFASLPVPTVAAAQRLTGFDRPIGGSDALEIIPVSNPLALRSGDSVRLEVRFQGKALASRAVSIIGRVAGPASAQELTTDEHGRITFVAGPADYYLTRVNIDDQSQRLEGQVDKTAYEATYVFPVFRR